MKHISIHALKAHVEINIQEDDLAGSSSSINVITKEQDLLFDIINKLPDDERGEYLFKLKKLFKTSSSKPKTPLPINKYDLTETINRFKHSVKPTTLQDLQHEVHNLKAEVSFLRTQQESQAAAISQIQDIQLQKRQESLEHQNDEEPDDAFISLVSRISVPKFYIFVKIIINDELVLEQPALFDTGAASNCFNEGLIPTKFFEKTTERFSGVNQTKLDVKYKISNVVIENESFRVQTPFILVKNMGSQIILGAPFAGLILPYLTKKDGISFEHLGETITFPFTQNPKIKELNLLSSKQNQINFLKEEISFKHIESQIEQPQVKNRIQDCLAKIHRTICSDLPNAFWNRKKHVVDLPYESTFSETQIPTKSRPIQMTSKLLETCKTEIQELLDKKLIRKSRSPWSCAAFYVNKNAEIERGTPRLVINYKPLNSALRWIRYPIPNKFDLLKRLYSAKIFSKFDMKSGFW